MKRFLLACLLLPTMMGFNTLSAQNAQPPSDLVRPLRRWEVGGFLFPSSQRMVQPSSASFEGWNAIFGMGAGVMVRYHHTSRLYFTAGFQHSNAGHQLRQRSFVINGDTITGVKLSTHYLNFAFGGGLRYPLGQRLSLAMELQGVAGAEVLNNQRTTFRGREDQVSSLTGDYNRYVGFNVSAGLRARLHDRVHVEVMPSMERSIGFLMYTNGFVFTSMGLGIRTGAYFNF